MTFEPKTPLDVLDVHTGKLYSMTEFLAPWRRRLSRALLYLFAEVVEGGIRKNTEGETGTQNRHTERQPKGDT